MSRFLARWVRVPARITDLALLFALAWVVHPLVPRNHWLARDDLLPWMTTLLCAVVFLRGDTLGAPPHPSLAQPEGGFWSRHAARLVPTLVPLVVLLWFDTVRLGIARSEGVLPELVGIPLDARLNLALAAFLSAAVLALGVVARGHRRTAWEPGGLSDGTVWTIRIVGGLVMTVLLGAAAGALSSYPAAQEVLAAGVLGLQFFGAGLALDPPQVHRQRRATGLRDGNPHRVSYYRYLLALCGPSVGFLALLVLDPWVRDGQALGFAEATVVAVHVLAWGAALWPGPTPIAVYCLLHEVVPYGGNDPQPDTSAVSFEAPPSGALRLNPRRVRQLRAVHPWLVSVRGPRLESLDDPIRPLWRPPAPPLAYHVLGDARFEPDPATNRVQTERITLHLSDQTDIGRVHEGNAQQRRLVVLRPFPRPGTSARPKPRTYRWEAPLPHDSVQIVDATTRTLELTNGDVIVLSIEGVARAFELEIGAPVYNLAELGGQRPAQLEDYVGLS